jgi:DNA-binding transcriptional LysR family regulator
MASRDHPLAHETKISIERLADEPFIMREPGSATREAVQALFGKHGVSVKVRMELGSNEAIKQAIAGGLGISILSRHTLALVGATNAIAILPVEEFPIRLQWHVVYPNGRQLSVIASTFLDYLQTDGKGIAAETIVP